MVRFFITLLQHKFYHRFFAFEFLLTFWLFINQLANPMNTREMKKNNTAKLRLHTVLIGRIKHVVHCISHNKNNTL